MSTGKDGQRTGQREICLHKIGIVWEVKGSRAVGAGGVRVECCSLGKVSECETQICGSLLRICLLIRSSLGNGCSCACNELRVGEDCLSGFLYR